MGKPLRLIHNKNSDGSITVFLSLILLIILSLILTTIESARINTAKVFAERAFTTAMDSVLAEYYRPLMDEYHLLALDTGYGGSTVNEQELVTRLEDYMSYTFEPNKDILYREPALELYDISSGESSVTNRTGLMDYNGEIFINEAVEYMKYKELGNGMELLLDKMSLLEEPERVSVLYEEKSKVEEELVGIDEGILALMKLLDGVATGDKGLKVNKDGTLKTLPDFVKKICYGTVTKEKTGINNESIFEALMGSYVDPTGYFNTIEANISRIDNINKTLTEIDNEITNTAVSYSSTESTLSALNSQLSGMDKKSEGYEALKSQIEDCEASLTGLYGQLNELLERKETLEYEKKACTDNINSTQEVINTLIKNLKPVTEASVTAIDKIIKASGKAAPLIKGYEESLNNEKSFIGEDIYSSLKDGLDELKRYQEGNKAGYDFDAMKETLLYDQSVLTAAESLIKEGEQSLNSQDYQSSRESFRAAQDKLAQYRTDGLKLDYSTLVISKTASVDPLDMMKTLIQDGMTGLVIDSGTVSKVTLKEGEALPSEIAALTADNASFDFMKLFGNMAIGNKETGMSGLFGSFGDYGGMLKSTVNQLTEHVLFQAYMQEHYYRFPVEGEDTSGRKPSALTYEQEYLLSGKGSDKDNLYSVISKLIFLRTITNFISVLGDKKLMTEAKVYASSLVGFTGLPVLVAITQTLLIILIAFAEALTDTCALLKGKEVELLKKKINFTFPELLTISRETIQSKAASYGPTGKRISLNYPDYLKIFLFIKNKDDLSYRCMDLIQENLRLRYEDTFSIKNCLFGFEAETEFIIKPKFTTLPFVRRYIDGNSDHKFRMQAGYSY